MHTPISICWLRRDLRLNDNAALYHAFRGGVPVLCVFLFDKEILNRFEEGSNAQVEFIHHQLTQLQEQLAPLGSSIQIGHSTPELFFEALTQQYAVQAVYTNEDYELSACQRDQRVSQLLAAKGIALHSYKDHVIMSKDEVLKDDNTPYTVFTPYSRKWKQRLTPYHTKAYPCSSYYGNFYQHRQTYMPSLSDLGFSARGVPFPPAEVSDQLIRAYGTTRDYPALNGTSNLGIHLRFGTISIRQLVNRALELSEVFLNELIWREFYHAIAWHFPHICEGKAFKPQYDNIAWRNNEAEFEAWCKGKTGYPLVDAGMHQLNATGIMHNRVRMVTASFLIKHLLIDWRWGEAYFANKLLDFDFAANNGGWQWAASSGCDAVPYFRIFNPRLQTEKFDKQLAYIHQWLPHLQTFDYPPPIVDHELARKRVLEAYAKALQVEAK
ncbi:MAG: hypothetical protein RL662_479 [Bacteroidota bacterium]|jgi:deoxyribodipyrimidine photo-lyase